jgi:uncharacterized protein (TIGR04255 family)
MTDSHPPFFAKAPVIERVLGVQFEPFREFSTAHLGQFWSILKQEEWPTVSDAPSAPPQFERFSADHGWQISPVFMNGIGIPIRIQIKDVTGNRIIQMQNGAIHYNWLNNKTDQPYVRFAELQNEFLALVEKFRVFAAAMGEWKPNQWEITYVNHLPKGTVWNSPQEWNRVFSSEVAFPYHLPRATLESFSGQWRYELESQRGRLYVNLQHANKMTGEQLEEILALQLTARGPVSPAKPGWELLDGLELGHDAVVRGFAEIVSPEAKRLWEEK